LICEPPFLLGAGHAGPPFREEVLVAGQREDGAGLRLGRREKVSREFREIHHVALPRRHELVVLVEEYDFRSLFFAIDGDRQVQDLIDRHTLRHDISSF
jgi:hypothetical protein